MSFLSDFWRSYWNKWVWGRPFFIIAGHRPADLLHLSAAVIAIPLHLVVKSSVPCHLWWDFETHQPVSLSFMSHLWMLYNWKLVATYNRISEMSLFRSLPSAASFRGDLLGGMNDVIFNNVFDVLLPCFWSYSDVRRSQEACRSRVELLRSQLKNRFCSSCQPRVSVSPIDPGWSGEDLTVVWFYFHLLLPPAQVNIPSPANSPSLVFLER